MEFERQKSQRLEHVDLSRKGSIDTALQDTVCLINSLPNYFTTSCCSGRIILFENVCPTVQKKGCRWLHVSHECVAVENLESGLKDLSDEAVLKFEPMVMHIQCRSLEDAQKIHQRAVASGFRNSGITVGTKGKIMIAVRSTHSLEAPLSSKGQVLVSTQHLEHLVNSANSKMKENFIRIERFYKSLLDISEVREVRQSRAKRRELKNSQMEKRTPPQKDELSSKAVDKHIELSADEGVAESLSLFMFENT